MKKNRAFSSLIDYYKRADKITWLVIIIVTAVSLLMLQSVSRATNENYYQVQLMAIGLGTFAAIIMTFIDYATLANYWILIATGSVLIMIYTMLFGVNISGSGGVSATAWIEIAGSSLQPSEFVKIAFLLTYSKHIQINKNKGILNNPINVFMLGVHAIVPIILCSLQGDDGAGVVFFFMFVFMTYAAGVHVRYFIILGLLLIISLPLIWNFVLSEYQVLRFSSVYNLDDPEVAINEGYQQYQARISIGSGGLLGQGLFEGARVESNLVTFQHSDFIFSVIGEELGFVGSVAIIVLLLVVMMRIIRIANFSRDTMGKVICYGFLGLIATQTIANIGMCLALLPVMGVTLPFFSAGGTSAISMYFMIGLIQSVYMHKDYKDGIRLKYRNIETYSYSKLRKIGLSQ